MERAAGGPCTFGRLTSAHDVDSFDCGNAELNHYLRRHALGNQRNALSTTHVAAIGETVVGYITLTMVGVGPAEAPKRLARGVPGYGMPALLLARLAVDVSQQGSGLGRELFLLAARAAVLQSDRSMDDAPVPTAPIRIMLVHAKDEAAAAFYRHMGMLPSPTDPQHLMIACKDLRATLGESTEPQGG